MPNLIKCELGNLPVSGVDLPVVVATVDNMDFPTWGDFYTFAADMMEGLGGTPCAFTCFFNRYAHPEVANGVLNDLTPGTENYGNSVTGFGFTRYVGTYSGDVNAVGLGPTGTGTLLYKNKTVWYTNIFGGSAPEGYPIKMEPIILFANENDYIYSGWLTYESVAYWSGGWGGLNLSGDCLPFTELPADVNAWYRPQNAGDPFLTLTAEDEIGDAIENRVPVGGDPEDPYSKGGYATGDDGGFGDYDYEGDPQPFGDVPSAGLSSGMFT